MFFILFKWKTPIFLLVSLDEKNLVLTLPSQLTHGVTGNTSGFGPEESRFEP